VLCLAALAEAWMVSDGIRRGVTTAIGVDFNQYLAHAQRWLAGGSWYLPEQLAGPYSVEAVTGNVYPPTLLYAIGPFAAGWLPLPLWWILPIGAIALGFLRHPPAWWGYPLLALTFAVPRTWTILVLGNPAMWSIALAVWGVWWGWPAWGAAIKATFVPLVLTGVRHRRRWLAGLAVGLVLCVPFGSLWVDYVRVLLFTRSERGPEYILGEWPTAILLVAVAFSASYRAAAPGANGEPEKRETPVPITVD
jgi:hypothetical protein